MGAEMTHALMNHLKIIIRECLSIWVVSTKIEEVQSYLS